MASGPPSRPQRMPNLTRDEYRVLCYLVEYGPTHRAAIAADVQVAPQTLARWLDRLVSWGLVNRIGGERSYQHHEPTPKAMSWLASLHRGKRFAA